MALVQLRSGAAALPTKETAPKLRVPGAPLRIVMVIPHDAEKDPFTVRTHRYAKELVRRGHCVEVFYWARAEGVCVHELEPSIGYTALGFGRLDALRKLYHAIRQADVVHFQKALPQAALPAVVLGTLLRKPLYQDWDDFESYFQLQKVREKVAAAAPISEQLGALIRWVTVSGAERLVPKVSDSIGASANELRKQSIRWGADPGAVFPARVGVDVTEFGPHRRDQALRDQLRLGTHPVVLLSGSFHLEADIRFFVDALVHLFANHRTARAWVVGGGPGRARMIKLISERGLSERVVVSDGLIPFSEMPRYVASADVAALPFRDNEVDRSKSSLTLLECMASGLPVVTHDIGEVGWTLGKGGTCAPLGDVRAFAEQLSRLCDSKELRQAMGLLGRQRVTEQFQWIHAVDGVEDAYYAAIRRSARSPS